MPVRGPGVAEVITMHSLEEMKKFRRNKEKKIIII